MFPQELCLDANVFLATTSPLEEGHEDSLRLMELVEQHQTILYEPAVVLFEVLSGLRKKAFLKELKEDECERAIDLFLDLPLLLQWQPLLLKKAYRWARNEGLKYANDGVYVAVASTRSIPLVTMDGQILKRAGEMVEQIYSPRSLLLTIHA